MRYRTASWPWISRPTNTKQVLSIFCRCWMHSAIFTQTKISSYKVRRLSPPIWLDCIAPWAAAGIWGEPYPRASRHRESRSIAFGLRLGRVRFVAGGHPQNTQAPFAFADAANAAATRPEFGPPHFSRECYCLNCFSHALNWGRQYFGTKRSHTWKYVSALL